MAFPKRWSVASSRAARFLSGTGFRALAGFTLAELIVVITVLAVLATVGFLALSGYSQDAKDASVKANVRSVMSAISSESALTGNSPRYYVVHDPAAALSGAVAYADGDPVVLTGGDWNQSGTNYSAGNPDYAKLKLNPEKFRTSSLGKRFPDASAAYDPSRISVGAYDSALSARAGGKGRSASFFQVAGTSSATKAVSVVGNFPLPTSAQVSSWAVSGLVRNPSSASFTGALVDWPASGFSSGPSTPANSCAANPSFSNLGTLTVGSPMSVGQAWTYSATPGNCTYTCLNGYSGANCATAPTGTFSISKTSLELAETATITNSCSTAPTSYVSSNTSVVTVVGTTITPVSAGTANITPIWGFCLDSAAKSVTVLAPIATMTVTKRSLPTSMAYGKLYYWNGTFIATQTSGAAFYTSSDGIAWTSRASPVSGRVYKYFYAGTKHVFWLSWGNQIYATSDFTNYSSDSAFSWAVIDWVTFDGTKFVAAYRQSSGNFLNVAYSSDWITWTHVALAAPTSTLYFASPANFYSASWKFLYLVKLWSWPTLTGYNAYTSPDGVTWTQTSLWTTYELTYCSTVKGKFTCANDTNSNAATSSDWITWSNVSAWTRSYVLSEGIELNSRYVSFHGFGSTVSTWCRTTADGTTWSSCSLPIINGTSWTQNAQPFYANGFYGVNLWNS